MTALSKIVQLILVIGLMMGTISCNAETKNDKDENTSTNTEEVAPDQDASDQKETSEEANNSVTEENSSEE